MLDDHSQTNPPPVGSYVTGRLFGKARDCRQGVLVAISTQTAVVKGQLGTYLCCPDVAVVPDANLWGGTAQFVADMRSGGL